MAADQSDNEHNARVRERLIELDIDRFLAITLDLFKWITAATLSINAAPLIAMLGSDKIRGLLIGPGVVFAVGLSCSLFGNLLLIKGLARAGEELFKAHWSGESVKIDDYDAIAPDSDLNRWTLVAAVLLGCSVGAFLIGIVWLGVSVK